MSQREKLQEMIDACDQAILDVLAGKSVTFNGRSVTRESLSEIRLMRKSLQEELAMLIKQANGTRHRIGYANLKARW